PYFALAAHYPLLSRRYPQHLVQYRRSNPLLTSYPRHAQPQLTYCLNRAYVLTFLTIGDYHADEAQWKVRPGHIKPLSEQNQSGWPNECAVLRRRIKSHPLAKGLNNSIPHFLKKSADH